MHQEGPLPIPTLRPVFVSDRGVLMSCRRGKGENGRSLRALPNMAACACGGRDVDDGRVSLMSRKLLKK